MSAKTEHDDDSDGPGPPNAGPLNAWLPNVNISTIDKRWVNHDLEILRTGSLADAEIICEGNAAPRKVHRIILAGRSDWFNKVFTGDSEASKQGKIRLQESPWQVDLMLYFLYTGGIDLDDETLTCGHELMDISIELSRLGDDFQSTEMQLYGKDMLAKYLGTFLSRICSSGSISFSSPAVDKTSFDAEADFPKRFCSAIVRAYNRDRPAKLAQDVLADFAFAARIHLFKNNEFLSFVRDGKIPEFGNRVLTALMDGSVSDSFKDNSAFEHWKDWRVTPKPGLPSMSQGSSLFGTSSPDVAASGHGSGHGNGGGPGVVIDSSGSFAGTTGYDELVSPGTASVAFSPCLEKEPYDTSQNSFQNILFQEPYKKFSTEELRMADYSQGRRYGKGLAGGSGAFGTASGSGGGLFGSTTTQNTSFGNDSIAGFGPGFGFGMAAPK